MKLNCRELLLIIRTLVKMNNVYAVIMVEVKFLILLNFIKEFFFFKMHLDIFIKMINLYMIL